VETGFSSTLVLHPPESRIEREPTCPAIGPAFPQVHGCMSLSLRVRSNVSFLKCFLNFLMYLIFLLHPLSILLTLTGLLLRGSYFACAPSSCSAGVVLQAGQYAIEDTFGVGIYFFVAALCQRALDVTAASTPPFVILGSPVEWAIGGSTAELHSLCPAIHRGRGDFCSFRWGASER